MIQLNLLPDVKLAFIKAERQKRLVSFISVIVIIASLVVLAFLWVTVTLVQSKSLSDLDKDIDVTAKKLQSIEDLDKILTVQSQLGSLASLHDEKVVTSRLYDLISKVTPADASISNLKVDFTANTMEVIGKVENLKEINKYTDSFKFTTYKIEKDDEPAAAFANVVLSAFSRQGSEANYTLTMNFDPKLFEGTAEPRLTVPNITSTRPDAERPTPLFQPTVTDESQPIGAGA